MPSLRPALLLFCLATVLRPALAQGAADASVSRSTPCRVERTPELPLAITSFGACTTGGSLYVYGGHIGREHAHSRANVVGRFQRLRAEDADWESLPEGPALQGTALVAAGDGALYRVGGLSARNEPDAEADLHSTASVARFDAQRSSWEELTPLPEARSSHDALVLDHQLYIAGGWNLHGDAAGDWLTTVWVADLRESPLRWRALPPLAAPRRACALAVVCGKVAVLGGMGPDGPLTSVCVLDPARGWTASPPLPGFAFGTAALGVGDRVLATVFDGRLLAWDGAAPAWQAVAQLETPRFFHRLVATADGALLALGGAGRRGHLRDIERIELANSPPTLREVPIEAPGIARQRQTVLLHDDTLFAFGGNRGDAGDRFAAGQFHDAVWRVDLAARTAKQVATLPAPAQSMAAVEHGKQLLLVGGLGVEGADRQVRSLASAFRFDAKRNEFSPLPPLPAPRTQCQVVVRNNTLWVLGGTNFTPGADGGTQEGDPCEVLQCDLAAAEPAFTTATVRLPRPRRSFGTATLADELFLIGGLGEDFDAAGPADVFDFATGSWRSIEMPAAWVSPQVAAIGERLYVACGGTMQGQRFTEDRSLWSWSRAEGWRQVLRELPFATRHVNMLARRNRLLFYSADGENGGRIVLRTLAPDPAVHVIDCATPH